MNTTKVVNLLTGKELHYSLPPEKAVKVAHLQQEQGNYNTWEYDNIDVPVQYGVNVVTCGNCTALLVHGPEKKSCLAAATKQ